MASQAEIDLIVNATNTLADLQRDIARIAARAEATAPTIHIPVDVDREGALRRVTSSLGPALGTLSRVGVGIAGIGAAAGTAAPLIAGVAGALQQIGPAAAVATQGMLAMQLVSGTLKLGLMGVSDAVTAAFDPDADPAALAEAMSKLAPEAQKFVAELAGMKDGFSDLQLEVQDRLFQGLSSNLRDLGTSVLPVVRTSLNGAADSLNAMARGAANAASDLGTNGTLGTALKSTNAGLEDLVDIPAQAVTAFGQLAAAAGPSFERITSAIATMAAGASASLSEAFESGALEDAINDAVDAIAQLGRVAGNVFGTIGNIIDGASQNGQSLFGTLETITQALEDATGTKEFQNAIGELSKTMSLLATTAGPILAQAIGIIGEVLVELTGPARELITVLGDGLSRILTALGPVLVSLASAFGSLVVALLPIIDVAADLVVALLPALVPLFDNLGKTIEAAAPFVEQLASTLGQALVPLFESLTPILEAVLPPLVDMAEKLFPQLTDVLVEMTPLLVDLATQFADVAVQAAPLIATVLELYGAIAGSLMPVIGPVLIGLLTIVTKALSGVANMLSTIVIPALQSTAAFLSGDFSGAAEHARTVYENMRQNISNSIGNMVSNIRTNLNNLVQALGQKALEGATRFRDGMDRLVFQARERIAQLPGQLRAALGNVGSVLYSAGASIIQGLIDGIQSKISSLVGTLGSITNMIPDLKGPAVKDAKLLTPSGELIMEGLMAGIQAEVPALTAQLQAITFGIPNTVNQGVSPIGQRFNTAAPGAPAVYVSIGNEAVDQYVTTRVDRQLERDNRVMSQGVRR